MKLNHLFNELSDEVLASFEPKDHLNPVLWTKDLKLKPQITRKLLKIAEQYYKFLDIKAPIKDIIFTGSNANYNWGSTKYSDIDLHIIIQYSDINENQDLVLDYMFDKKSIWGNDHDITIYDYPVELFAQDQEAKLPFDAGIYSVKNNKWVQEPKEGIFKLNSKEVLDKAKYLEKAAGKLFDSNPSQEEIERVRNKIASLRKDNLSKGGEFDPSNLAYKYLRRKGIVDKLKKFKNKLMDKELTLQ